MFRNGTDFTDWQDCSNCFDKTQNISFVLSAVAGMGWLAKRPWGGRACEDVRMKPGALPVAPSSPRICLRYFVTSKRELASVTHSLKHWTSTYVVLLRQIWKLLNLKDIELARLPAALHIFMFIYIYVSFLATTFLWISFKSSVDPTGALYVMMHHKKQMQTIQNNFQEINIMCL